MLYLTSLAVGKLFSNHIKFSPVELKCTSYILPQKRKRKTVCVSPFVLQLLAAALQQNKASLFVNVTHLILKGGDLRLKLLSLEMFVVLGQIEANFHYFTSYLHSAVVLRIETHQMMK